MMTDKEVIDDLVEMSMGDAKKRSPGLAEDKIKEVSIYYTEEQKQTFMKNPDAMMAIRQLHAQFKERFDFENSGIRLVLSKSNDNYHLSIMSVYAFKDGQEKLAHKPNNVIVYCDGGFDLPLGEYRVIIHPNSEEYLTEIKRLRDKETTGDKMKWGGCNRGHDYITYTVHEGENRIIVEADRRPETEKTPVYIGCHTTPLSSEESHDLSV